MLMNESREKRINRKRKENSQDSLLPKIIKRK